jgi:hypothetical protein
LVVVKVALDPAQARLAGVGDGVGVGLALAAGAGLLEVTVEVDDDVDALEAVLLVVVVAVLESLVELPEVDAAVDVLKVSEPVLLVVLT